MEERKSQFLSGMIALSVGLVLGLGAISTSLRDIRRGAEEVSVTGSARRPIRSDFVIWKINLAAQNPSLASASQELSRHSDRLRAFLKEEGIADSAVIGKPFEAVGVPEVTSEGRETGRILTNRVSQTIEVRSADVDGLTRVSQRASRLIADGVPISPMAPEYLYTKLSEIRIALLADATKDAKLRAEAIVTSTGAQIGAVRDAKMGVFQITPRFSTEVADYGINDVSSIDKDVTAVVRVTFQVR